MRVPGSSANLGPGFDVLGLALELYLEARATEPQPGAPPVRISGPHGAGISTGESNLVLVAFRAAFERQGLAAPQVSLELNNAIPLGRGLGSSGAALVAGVALANYCGRLRLSTLEMLTLAAELEGHPDNVAASCLGGLAVVCPPESPAPDSGASAAHRGIQALALPWPAEISVVIAVPDFELETKKARAALPLSYNRADAVFNLQRLALLVGALACGRPHPGQLAAALADRLHQPYRAPLVPGLSEALRLRAPGLLGVALSGAGPSLIALVEGGPQPTIAALQQLYRELGLAADVRPVNVDTHGVTRLEA